MDIKNYLDGYNNQELKPGEEPKDPPKRGITWVTRVLWWCAGADRQLLEQSPMQDRAKWGGIGGIVFFTGLLAAVSGSYAIYMVVVPKVDPILGEVPHDWGVTLGSLCFGLIWGTIILNLDRFIISSTGKGDGSDKITGRELGSSIPRILIATILAFVISSPLEIRIQKSEIDAELNKRQAVNLLELNHNTDTVIENSRGKFERDLKIIEKQILEYDDEIARKQASIDDQWKKLEDEAEGKTGSGKAGRGPAYRSKKQNLERQEKELEGYKASKEAWTAQLLSRQNDKIHEIKDLEEKRQHMYAENELAVHAQDGLITRILISHDMGHAWIAIFLTILLIELGPIIFKMMLVKGVYDHLVENQNKRLDAYNGIIHKQELITGPDGKPLHKESMEFLELEQEIKEKQAKIEKQVELNNRIVDNWAETKGADIDNNPEDYYTEEA